MTAMLAEAYFHTLDPFAIEFPPNWPIAGLRWYGLAYAVGFLLAWWMVRWVSKRGWSPIPPAAVSDLMFAVILGVLVGGRLGYAIFYEPRLFITTSDSFPYWDLLAINKGGMASHGGMIGVIIACWWFGRKRGVSSLHILDVGSLACTAGLFLGRIANFINGELHGRAVPDQANPPPWSMKFPQELQEWSAAKLATLSEVVEHVGVQSSQWLIAVGTIAANPQAPPAEAVRHVNRVVHDLIAATQRHDAAVIEGLRPLLTAFYPSQLLQAITDGPILLGALILLWLKPRKPGVIGSWFLIIYGVLRIATEFFREPDQGVALLLGLSRGQVLSLLMVLVGFVCLWVAQRRDAPRLGGLFSKNAAPPVPAKP
jgi:phosphatidylglycerol:prolipoprotein diacylglycerol transferase